MGWFDGFFDGVKKFGSDVASVGKQVAGGVASAGSAVLEGGKTLLTDPKQFVTDVGYNLESWGNHIERSVQSGVSDISEGWDRSAATGNPFMFFLNAMKGAGKIASLGASDAIEQHMASAADVRTDELGNAIGLDIHEDTDAITRIFLEKSGNSIVRNINAENEIREAVADGDKDRANRVFGQMVGANAADAAGAVAKTVGTAATVVGGVAVIAGTGGAATPFLVAGGAGLAHITADMAGSSVEASFDKENVDDDVSRQVADDISRLQASGELTEVQAEAYGTLAQAYYNNASYMNYGDGLGEAYLGEGATNRDFKEWLFENNGLPVAEGGLVASVSSGIEAKDEAEGLFVAAGPDAVQAEERGPESAGPVLCV